MTEEIAVTSQDVLAVDLKTAARLLALTEGAVRKQLATGKREGTKNERGQWEEVLVRSDEIVASDDDDLPEAAGGDYASPLYQELMAEKDRRITSLEDEILFLRQRVQNLEMLLGQSLQNQKALLPPEEPKVEKPVKRSWFSFTK